MSKAAAGFQVAEWMSDARLLTTVFYVDLPAYVCVFPGQDVLGEGRGFEFILVKREIFDKKGWSVHSVE
jgi:hypothetical protein